MKPSPTGDTPSIGVVLTNYNHGNVIARALTALTCQESPPDRIVVVDDDSSDGSIAAIRPFLNDTISLVEKTQNEGLNKAIHSGLQGLDTDLIYFAAADDFVYPAFFRRVREAAGRHPEAAMVFGRVVTVTWPYTGRSALGLRLDGRGTNSGLLSPQDFFSQYYCRLGPMSNLSPATVYRAWALKSINHDSLLQSDFGFILDSFVVQVIGGKYPSYYIDEDCAAWTAGEGGARRFFTNHEAIVKFVLTATEHLRREPYAAALSPMHHGLYMYGLWHRAIQAGLNFEPLDFKRSGGRHELIEAYELIMSAIKRIPSGSPFPVRLVHGVLLGIPRLALAVSRSLYGIASAAFSSRYIRSAIKLFVRPYRAATRSRTVVEAPPIVRRPERRSISLLICNYNHGKYIGNAIEAIAAQARLPDELLLLDDGSTDNSFSIMRQFEAKYSWIRAIRKEKNEGYISGIRKLTTIARGDFIHRGASDDFMEQRFIADSMDLAEGFPHVGVVSSELKVIYELTGRTEILDVPWWTTGYKTPEQFRHHYLEVTDPKATLAPSTIFRRSVVEEVGGWRPELGTWDVSFVLQAAALKYGMAYVDSPEYVWVSRMDNWTEAAEGDLMKMTAVCHRYHALMRSPEFRTFFGDIFPEAWLRAHLMQAAERAYRRMAKPVPT
jgi:GT2 family glycosyltransferase